MTVDTVAPSPVMVEPLAQPRAPRRFLGLSGGQIVAAQVAVALVVAGLAWGPFALVGAIPLAALLVIFAWGRMRGRWLSEWFSIWLRYRGRIRRIEAGSGNVALLKLVHPMGEPATFDVDSLTTATFTDDEGVVALIEVGDTAVLPAQTWHALSSPVTLLPAPAPDTPPVRIQLLLQGVTANGASPASASYRQLTGGRTLAVERAVIAVRIQRSEGWADRDLERALSGAVRKVRAKLGDVPNRLLGEVASLRLLAELSGHDQAQVTQEGWNAVHSGGMLYASHLVERWPVAQPDPAHALLPRLLRLPCHSVAVSLTVGPWPLGTTDQVTGQLVVRLGAADQAGLSSAGSALRQVLAGDRATARRMDGQQLDGMMATLPLAGPTPAGMSAESFFGPLRRSQAVAGLSAPYGGSGLMIGVNRHQEPVTFRLFRPEATRVVLIGGVPIAQIIGVRAMALGAHVLVQTTRTWAWEGFMRGLGANAPLTVMAPGPVTVPPGTPNRPLLTIVDAGPVAADRSPGSAWHSTLVVRDDLSPVDVDVLSRADLALLQPLQPTEAAVAVSVLGLSRDQESWLSRAQPGMIGVVHRRSVRWAACSQTPYEQQLIGTTNR